MTDDSTIKKKSQENSEIHVSDNSSLHNYRTEIPNIVFDLGLDPFSLALYLYYKKVAGDKGLCFQKKSTLSKNLQMSPSTIKNRNKVLSQPFKELGDKPLIRITQEKNEEKGSMPTKIEIVDIWPANFKILSNRFFDDPPPDARKPPPRRQTAAEEDPYEEDPIKKMSVTEAPVGAPVLKIKTKNLQGHETTASYSDLYFRCQRKRVGWSIDEIEEAWRRLAEHRGPVSDWWKFLEGIVKNIRDKKKSQQINKSKSTKKSTSKKGEEVCKNEKTQKNYKNKSLDGDTSGPTYSESNPCLGTMVKEYLSGLQSQKGSSSCMDHPEQEKRI